MLLFVANCRSGVGTGQHNIICVLICAGTHSSEHLHTDILPVPWPKMTQPNIQGTLCDNVGSRANRAEQTQISEHDCLPCGDCSRSIMILHDRTVYLHFMNVSIVSICWPAKYKHTRTRTRTHAHVLMCINMLQKTSKASPWSTLLHSTCPGTGYDPW